MIMLCDTAGAWLGGPNTTWLIRGPDMKRTKSKDPHHRLNLGAWERNIRSPGPDDPPQAIYLKKTRKKMFQLVLVRGTD